MAFCVKLTRSLSFSLGPSPTFRCGSDGETDASTRRHRFKPYRNRILGLEVLHAMSPLQARTPWRPTIPAI